MERNFEVVSERLQVWFSNLRVQLSCTYWDVQLSSGVPLEWEYKSIPVQIWKALRAVAGWGFQNC
jgi:hypothetical protein